MQKLGFGRRLMAMLLTLAMIVSLVPNVFLSANAYVGQIYPDREPTGLTGGIDTTKTISWPIKIYDYLNDGMLFEYSSAQDTTIWAHTGGSYGGAKIMPMIGNHIGEDYTSVAGYYKVTPVYNSYGYLSYYDYSTQRYSFSNYRNTSAYSERYDSDNTEVVRSINKPVDWVSPMSLHLKYDHSTNTNGTFTKSYGWISNFARDDEQYYTGDQVRYMVIVYKTNDVYPGHNIRPYWAVSDSSYDTDEAFHGSAIDISCLTEHFGRDNKGMLIAEEVSIPKSTSWTYKIVDMKTNYATDPNNGIANNWTNSWTNSDGSTGSYNLSTDARVAGVGMSFPLCGEGEEMDISHIAYFSSSEEAENFGQNAVAFDNDPGEYIGYTITGAGAGGSSTGTPPTMGVSGSMDFTTASGSGWSNSTFKTTWSTSTYGIDKNTMYGPGYTYANVTCGDSYMDTAPLWEASSTSPYTDRQYVTIVYRLHGITSPTMGMWMEDNVGSTTYYAGGTVSSSGTTTGSGSASAGVNTTRFSIPLQSGDQWVAYTYDLGQLYDTFKYQISGLVSTINFIGIKFPGFTSSSQSMDIAYVNFSGSASAASTFASTATNYLNSFKADEVVNVESGYSKSSATKSTYNMGSNQSFTMLYANSGGGWASDDTAGGTNSKSNGYFNYQIGHSYMYDKVTSQTNTDRVTAKDTYDYPVSDSIFLLNTYSSNSSYLNGVDLSYDSKGNLVKRFDMSKLELGYTLYNTMKDSGVMTAGLLQSGMATYKGMDGEEYRLMQYKDDTISYIALLMSQSLAIPSRDGNGYNYNFVKGTRSPLFYEDWDGDGKLDTVDEDLDNDGHLDVNEDLNGDGELAYSEDFDGDGRLDVYEDTNGNGTLDDTEDIDGDGHLDVNEDLDGDGLIDPGEDVDGDGHLDVDEDRNGNKKLDLSEDIDGDGKLDLGEDKNGNGQLDEGEDLNHNDALDLDEDVNRNGVLDRGEDKDGDGRLDTANEDVDGDGHLDINEKARLGDGDDVLDGVDLATALRSRLGITFTDTNWAGTTQATSQYQPNKADIGSYAETSKKFNGEDFNNNDKLDAGEDLNENGRLDVGVNLLIGPYLKCAPYIETFYDAAYYLLHNIFVPGSYNHVEDDYHYLVMSYGLVTDENKYAYVFDAGFTYSDGTRATVYDDVKKTISQAVAEKKHHIVYSGDNTTTLHPFLPINDSKDVAGAVGSEFTATGTPYVREDGATGVSSTEGSTYADRNYNYVMAANGEFVFHKGDGLFFDFEGDDDVYMFVNGELVLDIGAAHSITKVGFEMNKYVEAAQAALAFLKPYGYNPDMDETAFLNLFTADKVNQYTFDDNGNVTATTEISNPLQGKYTDAQIRDYLRQHRLNLVDGNSYDIDFYYMERHGWGANMRIATNIVMTTPLMETEKTAYQGTDANGEPQEIVRGGLIDASQPVNYSFSLTNNGNTKLYKLSFADENIGVDISAADGLQVFGKRTTTKFTLTASTTLSVTGLNGIFDLNGQNYIVRADGTISWNDGEVTRTTQSLELTYDAANSKNNDYTLTLYQYDNSKLFNDVDVKIILGSGSDNYVPEINSDDAYYLRMNTVNTVKVLGVRVADAKGGILEPKDLTITINGYASAEDYAAYEAAYKAYLEQKKLDDTIGEFENKWCVDPITISVSNNTELMAFLTNMQDPDNQTGEGEGVPAGKSALYYGAGLWQHGTVTISGMWYTLSEEEQANKSFANTVYTEAYQSMNSEAPEKDSADHKVYCPGEPMYYQWADKPVFLEFGKLWTDVVNASQGEGNSLYEQNEAIDKLNSLGASKLEVGLVDRNGGKVAAINNYYEFGKWTTLPGSERTADEGYRTIYFKQIYDWKDESNEQQIYVYYWSDANKEMTKWPGEKMSYTKTDVDGKQIYQFDIPSNARYVVFSNGIGSDTRVQTEDISVPIVDYDKVAWDSGNRVLNVNFDSEGMHMFYVRASGKVSGTTYTALIPVTFYVTYVEDKTFVLDYGLVSEELTSDGALFLRDGLLGNNNSTEIELMGITTQEPSYITDYTSSASTKGDINRILFTPEAGVAVGQDETVSYEVDDGKFYVSTPVDSDGLAIGYNNSRYLMNQKIWFEPTDFMDQEINLWLALSVHEKSAAKPSETPADGQAQYHVAAPSGKGSVDIATEVQMYKKVTILPATVVYYEDDFSGIHYSGDEGKFEHHGEGSGSLTQNVDQNVPYGQDSTYQHSNNAEFSGNSMTTINIADTSDVASFSFKGTGFELISRTNAFDSASFVVTVKDSKGNVVKDLPIITEFTSTSTVCTHKYHNTNGYCTYCGKFVNHTYVEGVCSVCNGPRVDYYLMGYINSNDHGVNSTQFKFEDGKITTTFDSESYLAVHDSNNNQFYTYGYAGEATSAMLYHLNSFTEEQINNKVNDKLRVPGGVEVTLSLVDNGSGTLVLSYSHDPIVHGDRTLYYDNSTTKWENVYVYYWADSNNALTDWPGEQMVPVVTEDNLFYYQVPSEAEYVVFNKGEGGAGNQSPDQTIPGDNYVYKDGKWFVFGEEEPVTPMMTLYYENTNNWEAPYAYYWSAANKSMTSWPGVAMTLVSGNIYSVQLPADAENIIFSNNSASQTADLVIPGADQIYNNTEWSEYIPDAPTSNTIYFDNSMFGWSKVLAHYWNGSTNTEWPGLEMTLVEGTDSVYYIDVPLEFTGILFNNGSGTQTANASVPGDGYLYSYGTWVEYEPGDDTTYTVFLDNSVFNFSTPKAHFWKDGVVSTTWSGVAMTMVKEGLFSIEVPVGISNIIFNDNGNNQTGNLVVPGENYVFDGGWHIYGKEVTYRTVYFKNVNMWSNPTVYYWSDAIVSQMHNWPGTAMTHVGDGIYAAQVRTDAQYVIFSNNGSDTQKTETLTLSEDLPCYASGEWTTYPPPQVDRQLYYKNTGDWSKVYVYYWSASNKNMVAWPGVEMTYMYGDQYTAMVPVDAKFVIFNDGTPTPKLTLGSGNLYANGMWSNFQGGSGATIYYKNTENLEQPYVYYWADNNTSMSTWCGVPMTHLEDDIWYYELPLSASNVIFSSGNVTGRLVPPATDDLYDGEKWVTYVSGDTKEIQQVPVIRVNDLPYGEYTVTISGMPIYKDDTDWSKYQDKDYMASQIQPTYLYLDGVRIYQPMTSTNANYADTENGAIFTELRDLILEGKAAVATYDQSAAVYTGNLSWSENRNGFADVDENGKPTTNYLCNQLTGINDYMTVGPNNEVYVNGNFRDEAVIFYVKEQADATDRTLQIAARAINDTLFLSGKKSDLVAPLYQGVKITHPDGTTSYGWDAVDVIESGTEQYYVIDYTKCPYDAATGNYQVALYVRSGMVSFSMVKYKGLEISSTGMSQTSYKYTADGRLVEISNDIEGTEVEAANVILNLAGVSAQMASETFVGEENLTADTLTVPTLNLTGASLAFEDEIRYNIYFTASDVEDVVEMGLAIFNERLADGTIADAVDVVTGVAVCGDEYRANTRGIAAKKMADVVYFKAYAKLSDGSYVYSDVAGYSAKAYAEGILEKSSSDAMKTLVVAMLNYGAQAQQYFGYKTDALMNADLTAEQQALVSAYDKNMVATLVGATAAKQGSFVATADGFSKRSAAVSFEGAFSINYYFTPDRAVDGDVTMYYWTADTYDSADELTAENAYAVYTMTPGAEYWGSVVDIAAKELDSTVYVAAVYTSGGETYSTGVLAYSLGYYCESIASDDGSEMQSLAQATALYGSYAKDYFAN